MSGGSNAQQMGQNTTEPIIPVRAASGPGYLGPDYNPADQILPPAQIGVRRGGSLKDVNRAVKGVIYYGDMIGFGAPSSSFTQGMPGLNPLGVNYFVNSEIKCSNGAVMWEYVSTMPDGSALGNRMRDALAGVGMPPLRGMAPGMLEDAKSALNPFPIINAVVGSGYPQCKLVTKPVGDYDGKIENVDGKLLVDPIGLIKRGGRYFQQKWVQDTYPTTRRPGESDASMEARMEPIQLNEADWQKAPKIYNEDGCLVDQSQAANTAQPTFCNVGAKAQLLVLGDGTSVTTYTEGLRDYLESELRQSGKGPNSQRLLSLSVAVVSILCLVSFWGSRGR